MSMANQCPEDWCISYNSYDPADEGRREALFALGNGYLVSRAAAPESTDDGLHYPGTYRVGCYNRLTTIIEGKAVENESLVNLPNWLSLTFRIKGGPWFSLDEVEILHYRQELDMQQAILHRSIHFRDLQGRQTVYRESRFVSMDQPHLMALKVELLSRNWSGELEVKSSIDGNIINNNVKRYAAFNKRHLEILSTREIDAGTMGLKARTAQSGIEIALAARTLVRVQGRNAPMDRSMKVGKELITDTLKLAINAGEQVSIEKIATLYTSKDPASANSYEEARKALQQAPDFATLLPAHRNAWKSLWRRCRIEMDDKDQLRYFRLHMFQILQNISPHTAEQDVGVPPSGWQGEEYHGQIFWDELFIFPFLTFRFPNIARSLLLYRYRRLGEARQLAKQKGYQGAMFPWRSGSTGREETPPLQLNLLSGQWMEDHTCLQRHIGAIIAYNVCQYVQVTNDQQFLAEYGAELLLEIARFWASLAEYNPELERYEILGIAGPDEYHTRYPGVATPGINNNTYTNVMAAWTLCKALQVWDQLYPQYQQDLREKLTLREEEFELWETISRRMRVIILEDGTLGQFEGFDALEKFDLKQFRKEYGKERIDWVLNARGDSTERYQISKQADTSLLLYLFSKEELGELLSRLGYPESRYSLWQTIQNDIQHAAHESSLSRIVHAGALVCLDLEASWKYFRKAQLIDLLAEEDKGTTEGIHIGAMGGTLAVLQHHYLGLKVQGDVLEVSPVLPKGGFRLSLHFRGVEIECEASPSCVSLRSVHLNVPPVRIKYKNHLQDLCAGDVVTFSLRR